jgi:hypothetical protein
MSMRSMRRRQIMPGMLFFRFIKIVLSPPTIPIGRNDDASMSLIESRDFGDFHL